MSRSTGLYRLCRIARHADGRENASFFAWYGDMELVAHLWEAFWDGPIDVVVELHKPLTIGRRAIASGWLRASKRWFARASFGHSRAARRPRPQIRNES